MKSISSWDDLRSFGIVCLTGEACGLSYRILCDVTEKGKALLTKVFDIDDLVLHENWNRGSDETPHIGSIMLPSAMLVPIAVFALLENGCTEVWTLSDGSVVGIERSDSREAVECFKHLRTHERTRRFGYFGTAGDRNVHVMTGRVH